MIRGIDVAHWQGVIDWQAVADDGVRFAFVKAGSDHSAGGFTPDPTFARNLDGAAAAGIPVGVFIYSYAKSTDAVSVGMEKALAMLEPYRSRITWPVAYDVEEMAQAQLGRDACTAICNTACAHIAQAGYVPLIYANLNWLTNYLHSDQLTADIWLAHYTEIGGQTRYTGPWAIHQYSETGRVTGIRTPVDLDVSRVDYGAPAADAKPASDQPDAWARDAWDWAQRMGYLDGTRPLDPVTRQELAAVLKRVEYNMD